ncbi:MAG: 50S ribosomal protein L29 [Nanohaloarchaea archaeon SW_7_43_1]|nr:MAG: 50S ribosomal protein L29 [Nanohaloarchaea archaeon SW_7_43_1]
MAILKADEIRNMNERELDEKLADLKKEIVEERGQIETGGFADNPGRIGEIKKTIARIKTIQNED